MDVVFDRATLCIMESQEHRVRYMNLMKTLLAPGYTYLLTTFKHDDESYQGTDTTVEKVCELREITVQDMKSPLIEVTWRVTG
ncbi:hypothetical protein HPB52_017028 [Rhipicephalus sanguineus]|uniref:Uncharacterized protein n=1 Tax=Rhipicephalus sanguineus TaxID=34632 RepID=A0A9D4SQJ2_RHISA|nr:hypothetical protein HPB52_008887 [Rhipicephalus sanguineus]KAH7944199.1 hypothetical protein HPB52_017028 [Rhipicephalus sanguineus]